MPASLAAVEALAEEVFAARLQVGRFLRGWPLAAANAVRGLAVAVASLGFSDGGDAAPSWVVISRRADGKEVGRLSAGRDSGSGEYLLASVQSSLATLTEEEFLRWWHLDREG